MKIQPYVEKLNTSKEYKKFSEDHGDAFMIAGFFVLDFEMGKHMHQIDYYVPSKKKVAAFTLDDKVTIQMLDLIGDKVPEKMDIQTNIDLDALKGILEDEMKNRNMTEEIRKIIAVIQNLNGKKIWNLNCVLTGMELLNAHIEDESKTVLKMEKISMMELLKKVPPSQAAAMQGQQQGAPEPGAEAAGPEGEPSEAEKQEKLKKLEALEKAIEKEKEKIKEKAQEEVLGKSSD